MLSRSWKLTKIRNWQKEEMKNAQGKVEKISKGSLDSIPSPLPSVKIQIMGKKLCLRCKGKTLLGIVKKVLKTKRLLTSPSNICLITSNKLSRQWFEFSLNVKVKGSNPGYLLRFFLFYFYTNFFVSVQEEIHLPVCLGSLEQLFFNAL